MNLENTKRHIISFIRERAEGRPIVLGLSGGVDSSTAAFLAAEAVGHSNVSALIMPSSTNQGDDARLAHYVASLLHIETRHIVIDPILQAFTDADADIFQTQRSLGNLKARIRMCLLYGAAQTTGGLVLGTGNKSEIMVGYATKYGDAGCDLLPLGDLYKTEVWALARHLGVPQEIIDRPPTAGLWEGQTDEGELGISYQRLDALLRSLAEGEALSQFSPNEINLVQSYIAASHHKRTLPPVCVIH